MNNLRQQLCGFLIHEETPVESILADHPLEEVFQEIDSLLIAAKPDETVRVLAFLRDANMFRHPFRDDFQEYLTTSTVWERFQKLLRVPNFCVRGNTIYTIAKLNDRGRAYLLADAFPYYLENDPINLPRLLLELVWLEKEWNWSIIDQVADADHYLKRWSLCSTLDDGGSPEEIRKRFSIILDGLVRDPNPLVAAEAKFRFERIIVKFGPRLSKAEWRKEVKRIASLEPKTTFERTAMGFTNGRTDYTIDELDKYVASLG